MGMGFFSGAEACVFNMLVFLVLHFFISYPYASAQPGFLSLDCGGTSSYTDSYGILWTPDDQYITTGTSASVESKANNPGTSIRYLQRLRYFSDSSRKHCYALPAGFNQTYLLRTSFFYGNFDKLESSGVEFYIIIGVTTFQVASLRTDANQYYIYEFVVKSSNKTVDLCLISSSSSPLATAPFISAIEMRQLENGMYDLSDSSRGLIMQRRINLGAKTTNDISYPDDKYDRTWKSDKVYPEMRNYTSVATTLPVSPGATSDQPPSLVMSTAITSTREMIFEFPVPLLDEDCYFIFYFAELTTLGGNTTREFDVLLINGTEIMPFPSGPLDIGKLTTGPRRSLEVHFDAQHLTSPSIVFVPTNRSTLGPLVNAAELFSVKSNIRPGTEHSDKIAILSVSSHFNISGWSGDPCLPQPFSWDWITCDTTDYKQFAKITEINLSNMQLRGTVPQAIMNLKHLIKISLDNNKLEGPLPDLTLLKNLTILHLHNNKFTGAFPTSLLSIHNLSIQNNSFDCIPQELITPALNGSLQRCVSNLKKHPSNKLKLIGAVVAGAVVMLLLVGGLCCWISKRNQVRKTPDPALIHDQSLALASLNSNSRRLRYHTIVKATNSFNRVLGEGSFGPVYYGRLPSGAEIAVKVLSGRSTQGEKEFMTEIEVLSLVHHKNLVSFLGSCREGPKLMLVYEYLSNGTLKEHLYGGGKPTLSWRNRLEILLDAAQGLDYLHTSCNVHIIHRDVKTSNILLDSTMKAKVADFGLSKLYNQNGATHVSTLLKGTRGYLDPEYQTRGRLTQKSDVYSFGVVMLETVCGREPVSLMLPEEKAVLVTWVSDTSEKGDLLTVVDPKLSTYSKPGVCRVLGLAMQCVKDDSVSRPSMNTLVAELKEALKLEENGDSTESSTSFMDAR